MKSERVETWFLIPLVRDSDRKRHKVTLYSLLRKEIWEVAGGLSGPVLIEEARRTPGSWPESGGVPIHDLSRKYTVIISRNRIHELREVLERAANSFDQQEILFVVQGVDQSIRRDISKGFLKGDLSGR